MIAPTVTALGVFPKLRKSCSLPDRTTEEKKKRKTKTNEKLQPSNRKMSFAMKVLTLYIAISKNVVRENDECQLSNGDCTTEKKCGY